MHDGVSYEGYCKIDTKTASTVDETEEVPVHELFDKQKLG